MHLVDNDDRLLPADPTTRKIAAEVYASVRDRPILSPHGHVDPQLIAADEAFPDPAQLLIVPDHYVLRLLHANGVPLDALGRGAEQVDPREIWRAFASHWHLFAGTPVRTWFEQTFRSVFGLTEHPSAANANEQYDAIQEWIDAPTSRPRALFDSFGIEVLATTDDPVDDLEAHRLLREDPSFTGEVIPTFRPDRFLDPSRDAWIVALNELESASGIDCGTAVGLIRALESRRDHFRERGATATDTGVSNAWATRLSSTDLERIHSAARHAPVGPADAAAYRSHVLWELARMSSEDGLVMQLHPGVLRNHHAPTWERFGADTGHDIPVQTTFTEPLREMLGDFGANPNFRLVLFTVDETAFSREIAPLAGFYPSVFAGAPWWFLDSPDGIRRYREAVTDSAGFYKTSGFIDDTRAFLSIPARHDVSRRVDAGWLAELVVTGRLGADEASVIAHDLVDRIPRAAFRLSEARA